MAWKLSVCKSTSRQARGICHIIAFHNHPTTEVLSLFFSRCGNRLPSVRGRICFKSQGGRSRVALTPKALLLTTVESCYHERKRGTRAHSHCKRARDQLYSYFLGAFCMPGTVRIQSVKIQVSIPKIGAQKCESRVWLLTKGVQWQRGGETLHSAYPRAWEI